jgi:histone acetyltransferase (RNA polymerase elongator complex component)
MCCNDFLVHSQASKKYSLAKAPKLVEILNAVPEEYRSVLIPQ